MPGALPTFEPGDKATKALNASFLNSVVDRLREQEDNDRSVDPSLFRSSIIAKAVNATDSLIDVHKSAAALTVSLNLLTVLDKIAFQKRPLLSIGAPTSVNSIPAIAIEPIAAGQIGRVVIGGLAVCTVDVLDTSHTHANPTANSIDYLTSSSSGQVRILWKDSGYGPKTAVVLLNGCCEDVTDEDGSGSGAGAGVDGDGSRCSGAVYSRPIMTRQECIDGVVWRFMKLETLSYNDLGCLEYESGEEYGVETDECCEEVPCGSGTGDEVIVSCIVEAIPRTLYVTITGCTSAASGCAGDLNTTTEINFNENTESWEYEVPGPDLTQPITTIDMNCVGSELQVEIQTCGGGLIHLATGSNLTIDTTSPFLATGTWGPYPVGLNSCSGDTITITITE